MGQGGLEARPRSSNVKRDIQARNPVFSFHEWVDQMSIPSHSHSQECLVQSKLTTRENKALLQTRKSFISFTYRKIHHNITDDAKKLAPGTVIFSTEMDNI